MMLLPPRPYRVAAGFTVKRVIGGIALFVLGLAILVGGGSWQMGTVKQILADDALWSSGQLADGANVAGRETSHNFLVNDYDLDVEYADAQNAIHKGKTEFTLLVGSVEKSSPVSLKYDPKDPARYVISWSVEHPAARWAASIFLILAVPVLMGGGMLWLGALTFRHVSDVRRVAERSDEYVLELIGVQPVVVNGKHSANMLSAKYTPIGGKERVYKQRFPLTEEPLFSDGKRTHVVALVTQHAPDRPWIVRSSMAPFEMTPEQLADVRSKTV